MSIDSRLLSALTTAEHRPERFASDRAERLVRIIARRRQRQARVWVWRYKAQQECV